MPASTLQQQYPWYESHKTAVETIVACLQIDIETVLSNLDKKIRHQEKQSKSEDAIAA